MLFNVIYVEFRTVSSILFGFLLNDQPHFLFFEREDPLSLNQLDFLSLWPLANVAIVLQVFAAINRPFFVLFFITFIFVGIFLRAFQIVDFDNSDGYIIVAFKINDF